MSETDDLATVNIGNEDYRVPKTVAAFIEQLRHDLDAIDWRPIDTAPRDGTMVLLHRPDGVMLVGAFNTRAGVWVHIKDPTPTHWMPLPEPPES